MAKIDPNDTFDKHWYKDRYQYVLVQRRVLAVITVAALVCTLMAIVVIVMLIPQKTIEPYVIQVDQRSGITQYVDPVSAKQLTANEAVKNYFIVNYIRARDGYRATDLLKQYELVRLMSEPKVVYKQFEAQANANNSDSNIARLGSVGSREVLIKSISYLEPTVAQVRVVIEERADGINISSRRHKIILVRFKFAELPLTTSQRYVNPLGFIVLDYRVDEDAV